VRDNIDSDESARNRFFLESKQIEIPKKGQPTGQMHVGQMHEQILLYRLQHGDLLARNKFTIALIRLAGYIVYGAFGRKVKEALDLSPAVLEDFHQECLEFILKKAHRFNPVQFPNGKNNFFIANFKQIISRYVLGERTAFAIPAYMSELMSKIRQLKDDGQTTNEIYTSLKKDGVAQKAIEQALFVAVGFVSLDAPKFDSEMTVGDEITYSEDNRDTEKRDNKIRLVDEALDAYTGNPFIMQLIKARFVDDETLEKIGKRFGLTRERIRQLEVKFFNALEGLDKSDETTYVITNQELFDDIFTAQFSDPVFREIGLLQLGFHPEFRGKKLSANNKIFKERNLPIEAYKCSGVTNRFKTIMDRLKKAGVITEVYEDTAMAELKKALLKAEESY
jgi:hypothetical protein